jgi:hypothetical protein
VRILDAIQHHDERRLFRVHHEIFYAEPPVLADVSDNPLMVG